MSKTKKDMSWDEIGKAIGKQLEHRFKDHPRPRPKRRVKISRTNTSYGGLFYSLGLIGALVYYITTASSLLDVVLGILKAIVWPAFLVFELMKFLGM